MKVTTNMKLSIWTFCLVCIIPADSTKQSSLELSENRDFNPQLPLNFYAESENQSLQEDHRHRHRQVRYDTDSWERDYRRQNHGRDFYSRSNRNENDPRAEGSKVLKTYGRGKAQVTRQGQTVNVPNEYGRNGYRGAVSTNENEIKPPRLRGVCRECPTDQMVIASKGNIFVILPEPCPLNPKMWNHNSGPRPGSKIGEGTHTIRGYLGPKKKFCQYNYQVIVRHCDPLKVNEDIIMQCSAENSWGSVCNVSCGNDKETIGPTELECKEDLTWSNPVPSCKGKMDCLPPKLKSESKILCQTADKREIDGEFFPNGSTCRLRQSKKEISINCKSGRWRIIRKNKSIPSKTNKQLSKTKPEKKPDPCSPNPCQNGGTCLRPESNAGSPICKCRPQTRGEHCQMRECYYNICENDGLCIYQNEERICYCSPEYSGETCQNYKSQ